MNDPNGLNIKRNDGKKNKPNRKKKCLKLKKTERNGTNRNLKKTKQKILK